MDSTPEPDLDKTPENFRRAEERHRTFLADLTIGLDKGLDLNKTIASYFERLMLLALGSLAFSITVITSIAPKVQVPGFPKDSFFAVVIPAWVLLVFCTFCCWAIMSRTVAASRKLYGHWSDITINADYNRMWLSATELSKSLEKNGPALAPHAKELADFAAHMRKHIDEDEAVKKFQKMLKEPEDERVLQWVGKLGFHSIQIGRVLAQRSSQRSRCVCASSKLSKRIPLSAVLLV